MGNRANIRMKQDSGKESDLYLYTHNGGSVLPKVLGTALARGKARWDDEQYLARIIFSEMIKESVLGETGYGISTYLCDNENPIIVVDCDTQIVNIGGQTWTFEQFVKIAPTLNLRDYRE